MPAASQHRRQRDTDFEITRLAVAQGEVEKNAPPAREPKIASCRAFEPETRKTAVNIYIVIYTDPNVPTDTT